MRVAPDFLRRVDDWRRYQRDIPARAEAIRRLVELGIATASIDEALGTIWARAFALGDRDDLTDGIKDELEVIYEAIDDIIKKLKTPKV